MKITKEINLNITQPNNFQLIHVMQGTVDSVKVIAHLYDGNKPYQIPDTVNQYQILGILSSGKYLIDDQVTRYDDTSVTFVINQNMMAKAGYVKFSLSLVDSADQSIAETFPAKIMVTAIPGQDYEQTDEIPIITKSLQEVKEGAEIAVNAANRSEAYYNKLISEKGQPNGIATLDENTKVPLDELYEATTSSKGITQLEDSITSTSVITAATPNSVKIVNDALTTEISRAAAAESTLSQNLNAEITRATTAENDFQSMIDTNKPIWDDKYTKNEIDNKFSTLETNIDWKEAVATYDDIMVTYPNPEDGWTVNVKDTDYTYRYSGTEWVAISANAIPKSTQSIDGLQSKEDKAKLDGIATGAEVNQNTFSNIAVDSTTISADEKSDTVTFISGDNVTLTPDTDTDKVTISSSHPPVTHSTDTTSAASPDAGRTFTTIDSISRDANGHVTKVNTKTVTLPNTSVAVDDALSSTSANPVQNKVVHDALNTKLSLSGGTMTGDVILKNRLVMNDGLYDRNVIIAYDDEDANNYGSEIVITGSGNTFIGSGESPAGLRTALQNAVETGETYNKIGENTYITSDGSIYLYSGTSNDGTTRTGIMYDSSGTLRPLVAKTRFLGSASIPWNAIYTHLGYFNGLRLGEYATDAYGWLDICYNGEQTSNMYGNAVGTVFAPKTNNTGSIGLSNAKWENIYATTFTGNLNGTASTSTYSTVSELSNTNATTYFPVMASTAQINSALVLPKNAMSLYVPATTSSNSVARLTLGNSTAFGTAGSMYGSLRLYHTGSSSATTKYYADLRTSTNLTANRTIYLPNRSGTLSTDLVLVSNTSSHTIGTTASNAISLAAYWDLYSEFIVHVNLESGTYVYDFTIPKVRTDTYRLIRGFHNGSQNTCLLAIDGTKKTIQVVSFLWNGTAQTTCSVNVYGR